MLNCNTCESSWLSSQGNGLAIKSKIQFQLAVMWKSAGQTSYSVLLLFTQ